MKLTPLKNTGSNLDLLFEKHKTSKKELRIGILGTVAFHLLALVIILFWKLAEPKQRAQSQAIEIEFEKEKYDVKEEIEKQEVARQELVQQMLMQQMRQDIKNAVSNENAKVEENYSTKDLMDEMNANYDLQKASDLREQMEEGDLAAASENKPKQEAAKDSKIEGPTHISFSLKNRSGRYLKNPVYKCESFGKVVVDIKVNQEGKVVDAQVNPTQSATNDICLQETAVNAARASRFSVSYSAPGRQSGTITYIFMQQ